MTFNTSQGTKLANKVKSYSELHWMRLFISTTYTLSSSECKVGVLHSNALKKAQRDRIWSMYEDNMYELKNSSFGWNPAKKRKELFHSLSRFIIVHHEDDTLLAFVMFRFEHEHDQDIFYCYELQVAASSQGKGLGKKLLIDLEKIGREFNMEKIVVTVLKSNSKARSFYRSLGFTVDPTSPSCDQMEGNSEEWREVDYEILSVILS